MQIYKYYLTLQWIEGRKITILSQNEKQNNYTHFKKNNIKVLEEMKKTRWQICFVSEFFGFRNVLSAVAWTVWNFLHVIGNLIVNVAWGCDDDCDTTV